MGASAVKPWKLMHFIGYDKIAFVPYVAPQWFANRQFRAFSER